MFKFVGGILDRACAVAGALVVSQVPLFIQQYKQQLSGHVAELQLQVEMVRQAAMASGKTIDQFIKKFVASGDVDFSRQGEIMQQMVQRWHDLADGFNALSQASIVAKPIVFFQHFNVSIAKETVSTFSPGIPLTLEGGVYALIGIGVGYLTFSTIKAICRALWRSGTNSSAPKRA